MAQAPQPPHRSPPPPPPPLKDPAEGKSPAIGGGHLAKTGEEKLAAGPRPTIGVKGEPIEDGSRDPGTIAEEQRRRSAEIEAAGVEQWKAAHDERTSEQIREAGGKLEEPKKKLENHKAP